MVQMTILVKNGLIPNRTLVFARPNWTNIIHFGPFWPEEIHFGPFRSANRSLAIPDFDNPSGHGRPRRKSWTSAPKSGVFLRPRWWGETFWPLGVRAEGSGMSARNPDQKVYVYAVFSSLKFCEFSTVSSAKSQALPASF